MMLVPAGVRAGIPSDVIAHFRLHVSIAHSANLLSCGPTWLAFGLLGGCRYSGIPYVFFACAFAVMESLLPPDNVPRCVGAGNK